MGSQWTQSISALAVNESVNENDYVPKKYQRLMPQRTQNLNIPPQPDATSINPNTQWRKDH